MVKAIDISPLSGKKYPIYILAPTFSTVSLEIIDDDKEKGREKNQLAPSSSPDLLGQPTLPDSGR